MSIDPAHAPDPLAAARQALQAGNRSLAQRLLASALQEDANRPALSIEQQATAWQLLALVVEAPERKRYCQQRAAALQQNLARAQKVPPEQTAAVIRETAEPEDPPSAAARPSPSALNPAAVPVLQPNSAVEKAAPAAPKRRRRGMRWLLALAAGLILALLALFFAQSYLGLPDFSLAGTALLDSSAWSSFFSGAGAVADRRGAEHPLAAQPGAAAPLPTLGLPRSPTHTPTASPPPAAATTPRPTFNVFGAQPGPAVSITPFWGEWVLIIGRTVEGRPLEVVRFGTGKKERMIIAGIHGGDEVNTIRLADELIAYVRRRPGLVPPGYTLYILRALNPDGEARDHSPKGRYNSNGVDLNRNFDTNWKSVWRSNGCSSDPGTAGSGPGSEPETKALKAFLAERHVEALISYHSAGLGVFPSGDPPQPGSVRLAEGIAAISNYVYPPIKTGCEYTGTLVDWAADHGVAAAVDLELNTLSETEFDANRKILELLMTFDPGN